MRLFLYGTLLDPKTLASRSGHPDLPRRLVPATLMGWQRAEKRGCRYPTLRRHRSGAVRGALLTVPARALAELADYEGSAYRLKRVVVATANGKTTVHAWIAPDSTRRPWKE